jgi:hypothetical protein
MLVECIVRGLAKGKGYLVYLGNWSNGVARPVLAPPALAGKPRIDADSHATHALADATASSLTGLAVDLAPAELKPMRTVND